MTDAAPLEGLAADTTAEPLHLFDVKPATAFQLRPGHGLDPDTNYTASNPPYGITIWYYLHGRSGPVQIQITDAQGAVAADLTGDGQPGLHAVQWDLQAKQAGGEGQAAAGDYTVRVKAGDRTATKRVRVEAEE